MRECQHVCQYPFVTLFVFPLWKTSTLQNHQFDVTFLSKKECAINNKIESSYITNCKYMY